MISQGGSIQLTFSRKLFASQVTPMLENTFKTILSYDLFCRFVSSHQFDFIENSDLFCEHGKLIYNANDFFDPGTEEWVSMLSIPWKTSFKTSGTYFCLILRLHVFLIRLKCNHLNVLFSNFHIFIYLGVTFY